jgi:hypothetical protein
LLPVRHRLRYGIAAILQSGGISHAGRKAFPGLLKLVRCRGPSYRRVERLQAISKVRRVIALKPEENADVLRAIGLKPLQGLTNLRGPGRR